MDSRKREFIRFLEEAGVLKFGDFIAKSGRKLPYFLNAGEVKTGGGSARLGEFYAEGPEIVRLLKSRGCRVFLDLKLHDIPNTVKRAMAVLADLGADMVNVHAAGTRAMMEAALEGLSTGSGPRPLLLAVTQLTSTDQTALETELLIREPMERVVES